MGGPKSLRDTADPSQKDEQKTVQLLKKVEDTAVQDARPKINLIVKDAPPQVKGAFEKDEDAKKVLGALHYKGVESAVQVVVDVNKPPMMQRAAAEEETRRWLQANWREMEIVWVEAHKQAYGHALADAETKQERDAVRTGIKKFEDPAVANGIIHSGDVMRGAVDVTEMLKPGWIKKYGAETIAHMEDLGYSKKAIDKTAEYFDAKYGTELAEEKEMPKPVISFGQGAASALMMQNTLMFLNSLKEMDAEELRKIVKRRGRDDGRLRSTEEKALAKEVEKGSALGNALEEFADKNGISTEELIKKASQVIVATCEKTGANPSRVIAVISSIKQGPDSVFQIAMKM